MARLARRSGDCADAAAMTLLPLLPLLLILGALSASSAAPMTPSVASGPWRSLRGAAGASLGGGLGAGLGGRTLGELAESELERYALIMLDPASAGSDLTAGTVTRRITPKSVFIAPSINDPREPCADGYQQDDMNRCVKVVKVDADKSWALLLEKLNSEFANPPLALLPDEATPPPGPPPGPFQLTIPIAGVLAPAPPPSANPEPDQQPPSWDGGQQTEQAVTEQTATEAEEVVSTTLFVEDADEEETETPAPTAVPSAGDTQLVPEVVMLTSEERPQHAAVQGGAYLVSAGARPDESAPRPATSQPDSTDANPIMNTVHGSPLATGESIIQEVPPSPSRLVAEVTSPTLQQLMATALGVASQPALPIAMDGPAVAEVAVSSTAAPPPTALESSTEASSTVGSPTTVSPTTVSPTIAAPTAASSTSAPSTSAPSTSAPSTSAPSTSAPSTSAPSTVAYSTPATSSLGSEEDLTFEDDVVTAPTTTAPEQTAPPSSTSTATTTSTTTSTTTQASTVTFSTTVPPRRTASSEASSDESRPSSSNQVRPQGPGQPSRISLPVFAPDLHRRPEDAGAVRFPASTSAAERPTLLRTSSAQVRFPSIDVTFPSRPGGDDANRLPVVKPFAFPKNDNKPKPPVWLPPLPPAPSYVPNWSLEQTRTRPMQQANNRDRNRERGPALDYHFRSWSPSRLAGNGLIGGVGNSSSLYSSLSSSSSSSESSQALRRTLSHAHSHQRGGASFAQRAHRGPAGPSHRRGRDYQHQP